MKMGRFTVALGIFVVAFLAYGAGAAWLAIGLIMLSLVYIVFTNEAYTAAPREVVARTTKAVPQVVREAPKTVAQQVAEEEAKMATVNDLKFRPSTPSDGICGVAPMGPDKNLKNYMKELTGPSGGGVAVGNTSGMLTIDCGPIRFKEDLRIRPQMVDPNFMPEATKLEGSPGRFFAWHFRTQKPVYYQKTRATAAPYEAFEKEYWDHPGWKHED